MGFEGRELATADRARHEPSAMKEADQYLTFQLGNEQYGVDILRVQEIKGWTPVTRIPNSPDYLLGVLNLRGNIIPIVDMRLRFSLRSVEYKGTTVVIVLAVKGGGGDTLIGVVVDGVSDVIGVSAQNMKPPPDFGALISTEFIAGLATTDTGMVMLLNIDRLLEPRELEVLDTIRRQ